MKRNMLSLQLCVMAIVLLTAGALMPGSVLAAPWKFAVTGDTRGSDNGVNTGILAEIAHAITNENPELVIITGDLVSSGTLSSFQTWTNTMAAVYNAGIKVYPVRGNHDIGTGWETVFASDLPDNGPAGEVNYTYSVSNENALFIALDQYFSYHQVNQTWLDAQLASNSLPHVFVYGHEPAFKVYHTDCLDDYPTNREIFWNSLFDAGARVYFCGHDHFYDHARIDDGDGNPYNDLHQYVLGTGGAPLYNNQPYDGDNGVWTPTNQYFEKEHGYVLVEIDDNDVTLTWKHRVTNNNYVAAETFSYNLVDSDYDGMLDSWEKQYFGSTTNSSGTDEEDWDSDGAPDFNEYIAGTDPTNRESCLTVSNIMFYGSTRALIRWHSVTGKIYTLTRSTNLLVGFDHVLTNQMPATPPMCTFTDTVNGVEKAYYRISVH